MTEPSSNWTKYERGELMAELNRQRRELEHVELPEIMDRDERERRRYRIFDIRERIKFLESMPASFLEANRTAILRGKVRLTNGKIVDGE